MCNHKDTLLFLLKQLSVKRGTFTLASGKQSDLFIDCKKALLTAAGHYHVGKLGYSLITCNFGDPELVAGVELGGCSIASAISMASYENTFTPDLNAIYVRKSRKGHGTKSLVEGTYYPWEKVVLVEDVVTTGGSSLNAIKTLRDVGLKVLGVLAVVDRLEGASENFQREGIKMVSIFTKEDFK